MHINFSENLKTVNEYLLKKDESEYLTLKNEQGQLIYKKIKKYHLGSNIKNFYDFVACILSYKSLRVNHFQTTCHFNNFSKYDKLINFMLNDKQPSPGYHFEKNEINMCASFLNQHLDKHNPILQKASVEMIQNFGHSLTWNIIFSHELGHAISKHLYNLKKKNNSEDINDPFNIQETVFQHLFDKKSTNYGYLSDDIKNPGVKIVDELFAKNFHFIKRFSTSRLMNEHFADLFMCYCIYKIQPNEYENILKKMSHLRKKYNSEDYYTYLSIDYFLTCLKHTKIDSFDHFYKMSSLIISKITLEIWLKSIVLHHENKLVKKEEQDWPIKLFLYFKNGYSYDSKIEIIKKAFDCLNIKNEFLKNKAFHIMKLETQKTLKKMKRNYF